MSATEDDAAFRRVLTGLGVTGMEDFVAWVLGDAHATRYGAEPVGLPTGAGYAAGNRLVDAYLAQTGRTASECLLVAAADVIARRPGTPDCRTRGTRTLRGW